MGMIQNDHSFICVTLSLFIVFVLFNALVLVFVFTFIPPNALYFIVYFIIYRNTIQFSILCFWFSFVHNFLFCVVIYKKFGYNDTKNKIWELKEYIEANKEEMVLTHIDAVFDNFLFIRDGEKEYIRLIDWEYAGMQDPHIDIAMFAIYAFYDREKIDYIIDCYFNNNCEWAVRIKIYCYVAICGLLWSNWCEYKSTLGVEFGEYSIRQYRYAKEYYSIAKSEINKMKAGDQSAKSSKSDYISRRYGEENETINR